MSICLFELCTAAAVLARRASIIIQHVRKSGQLHVLDKAPTAAPASLAQGAIAVDPCTVADVLSQRLIIGALRQLFPALVVRGEEDENEADPQQKAAIEAEPAMHALLPHLLAPVLDGAFANTWRQTMRGVAPNAHLPLPGDSSVRVDAVPLADVIVWIGSSVHQYQRQQLFPLFSRFSDCFLISYPLCHL